MYRDATKLLWRGSVADATSIYFLMALATVLVCVACYNLLMSLPVSRIISGGAAETIERLITPPPSPRRKISWSTFSPSAPGNFTPTGLDDVDGLEVDDSQNDGRPIAEVAKWVKTVGSASFGAVLRCVWYNQLAIFLNFIITTLCYPGLITSIPCREFFPLRAGHWFQTLLLTAFTLADTTSRFFTHLRLGLHHGNIMVTVCIRAAIFPLMLLCAVSDIGGDLASFAVVAAFGAMSGFSGSVALIVVNEVPSLTLEQRKTVGRISAFSVNGGLCIGSLLATLLMEQFNLGDSSAS